MATIVRGKILRSDLAGYDGKTVTATRVDSTGGTVTGLVPDYEVDALALYGLSANRTVGTLNSAITNIGSSNATIVLAPGTWTIDSNVTIPSNINIRLPAGAQVSVDNGITLTIAGKVFADVPTDLYIGAGTVTVSDEGSHFGIWWKTAAEASASVTPSDLTFPPGDVRRYGAAGDGVTDDTTAIQNAINAATVYGGIVYLPSTTAASTTATYLVSAAIEIKSHVRVMGDTNWTLFNSFGTGDTPVKNVTIIRLANSSNDNVIEFVQDCISASIENVYIDGNRDNNTSGDGIHFVNNTAATRGRNTIKNVYVYEADDYGIFIPDYVEEVHVIDTYVDRADLDGILCIGQDCQFIHVWSGYNGGDGIEISGGGSVRLHHCDFFGNEARGIHIHDAKSVMVNACQINANKQEGVVIAKESGSVSGTRYTTGFSPSRINFVGCWFAGNSVETATTPANTYDEILLNADTNGPYAITWTGCSFGLFGGTSYCDYAINDTSGTVRVNAIAACQFESSVYSVATFGNVYNVYTMYGCTDGNASLANSIPLSEYTYTKVVNTQQPTESLGYSFKNSSGNVESQRFYNVNATSAPVALTLPVSTTQNPGKEYIAYKKDASANAVSFSVQGGDAFDAGATTSTTTQGGVIRVITDGAGNWFNG